MGHEAVSFGNELTQFQRNLLFQSSGYSKNTFETNAANSSETSVISINRWQRDIAPQACFLFIASFVLYD
jgi:hypothetical protein